MSVCQWKKNVSDHVWHWYDDDRVSLCREGHLLRHHFVKETLRGDEVVCSRCEDMIIERIHYLMTTLS